MANSESRVQRAAIQTEVSVGSPRQRFRHVLAAVSGPLSGGSRQVAIALGAA